MNRFLIIDLDKLKVSGQELVHHINGLIWQHNLLKEQSNNDAILSEEKAIAKFKEIWDEAVEAAIDCADKPTLVDGDKLENKWEELKKTL